MCWPECSLENQAGSILPTFALNISGNSQTINLSLRNSYFFSLVEDRGRWTVVIFSRNNVILFLKFNKIT